MKTSLKRTSNKKYEVDLKIEEDKDFGKLVHRKKWGLHHSIYRRFILLYIPYVDIFVYW